MNDLLFGLVLALAWFAATNVTLSLAASVLGWVFARTPLADDAERASCAYLALRLVPGALSLVFVGLLFAPAHWQLEPPNADESLGGSVVGLAILGAAILVVTTVRAVRTWRDTSLIARRWSRAAAPLRSTVTDGIPVLALPDTSAVIALVGFRRPTLFLSDDVATALTEEELSASLAHEEAHHRSRDNVKRLAAAWCPDALEAIGCAGSLGRRWAGAMELAADTRAAGGCEERAAVLASALVKVARLVSGPRYAGAAMSSLHDEALLAARVSRLLGPSKFRQSSQVTRPLRVAAGGAAVATVLLVLEEAWIAVHVLTEGLIRWLP